MLHIKHIRKIKSLSCCLPILLASNFFGSAISSATEINSINESNIITTTGYDPISYPNNKQWAMYQGNPAHSGYIPLVLDANNFHEIWTKDPGLGNLHPSIAVAGKVITTPNESGLAIWGISALDLRTGRNIWHTPLIANTNIYAGSPASNNNGKLYVHTSHGWDKASQLWSIDEQTGTIESTSRWPLGSGYTLFRAPTIYDNKIYLRGNYGCVTALDTLAENPLWESGPICRRVGEDNEPAVDENHVYIGGDEQNLLFLDRQTGEIVSSIPDASVGTPTLTEHGYVLTSVPWSATLKSFRIADRQLAWSYESADGRKVKMVATGGGQVFVMTSGSLTALNEETGEVQWQWQFPGSLGTYPSLVITATHAFVSSSNGTYAIDLSTHQAVWGTTDGGSLSISDQGVLLISTDSSVSVVALLGDDDGDGIPSWWEKTSNMNPNDPADAQLDTDGDGLTALEEYTHNTFPEEADTDGDSLSDGDEINTHGTNPAASDSDGDGLNDGDEIRHHSDPHDADTDNDGLTDGEEVNQFNTNPLNSDSDSMSDSYEIEHELDPSDASDSDMDKDKDGLTNIEEHALGTLPNRLDTDNDWTNDSDELNLYGTDPLSADTDNGGTSDGEEIYFDQTNPLDSLDENTNQDKYGATLFDSNGYRWEIDTDGTIERGTSRAFNTGFKLGHSFEDRGYSFSGYTFNGIAMMEFNGRELRIGPEIKPDHLSPIQVYRKIFVPENAAFIRYLEVLYNPTAEDIETKVSISTYMGSYSNLATVDVVATSSGDINATTEDDYIISDDADGADVPSLMYLFSGSGNPAIEPSFVHAYKGGVSYRFNFTIPPGEVRIIMHFGSQNPNRAAAINSAESIYAMNGAVLDSLTPFEIDKIINFDINVDTDGDGLTNREEEALGTNPDSDGDEIWDGIEVKLGLDPNLFNIPGDLDNDNYVGRSDIFAIKAALNSVALQPKDPRDINGDGMISATDMRALVGICTKPRCK